MAHKNAFSLDFIKNSAHFEAITSALPPPPFLSIYRLSRAPRLSINTVTLGGEGAPDRIFSFGYEIYSLYRYVYIDYIHIYESSCLSPKNFFAILSKLYMAFERGRRRWRKTFFCRLFIEALSFSQLTIQRLQPFFNQRGGGAKPFKYDTRSSSSFLKDAKRNSVHVLIEMPRCSRTMRKFSKYVFYLVHPLPPSPNTKRRDNENNFRSKKRSDCKRLKEYGGRKTMEVGNMRVSGYSMIRPK